MTRGTKKLRDELEQAPEVAGPDPVPEAVQDQDAGAAGDPGPQPEARAFDGDGDPGPGDSAPPPRPGRPRGEIWDGCPVRALGVLDGTAWYLDPRGQLRGIGRHGLDEIRMLFGDHVEALSWRFPQYDKDGNRKRVPKFESNDAAAAMVAAAHERGVFHPQGRVRGPGAWVDDDGGLIYHAGDAVLIGGEWQAPGEIAGRIYGAGAPVPRPALAADAGAGAALLSVLRSWHYRRPRIDPVLTLGAVGAQMLGGALDWRPVVWLTGDAATGKSTFQTILLHLHGGETGLLQAADATEAGIRSVLGQSSLPVSLDEAEHDPDRPERMRGVVELARRAASGGVIFRGGADQKGHQSQARSAFLFSSILLPPMRAQDRQRLIALDLDRLPPGSRPPPADPRHWRQVGATIKATLLAGWPLWPERLEAWRAALATEGITGRAADNYGTALACACAALRPARLPALAELAEWVEALAPSLTEAAEDIGTNADDMMTHLLGQVLDPFRRGQQFTVAQWVQLAADLPGRPDTIDGVPMGSVNTYLAPAGLRVRGTGAEAELCIATKAMPGLLALFKGSVWEGGGWTQAARRIEGAESGIPLTLAGQRTRGIAVPLRSVPGLYAFPAGAHGPAPQQAGPQAAHTAEDFL